MKVSGSYVFQAPSRKVWEVLLDPKVLAGCMPGCETLDQVGEDQYQAVLSVGIGPVRGNYRAKLTMQDQSLHQSYRLVFEGAGSTGFANGEALVTLVEQDGKTEVQVESEAQVGGMVARVGQRMVGGAAKVMMDRFFGCLQKAAE